MIQQETRLHVADNTARLKAVKHDIARMYTVLRERELGITAEPAAETVKEK